MAKAKSEEDLELKDIEDVLFDANDQDDIFLLGNGMCRNRRFDERKWSFYLCLCLGFAFGTFLIVGTVLGFLVFFILQDPANHLKFMDGIITNDNQMYIMSLVTKPNPPKFKWPSQINQIDCQKVFENDQAYMKDSSISQKFIEDEQALNSLNMSCEAIKSRNYFAQTPMSREEAAFPLAFAKIVYKDYIFLEMEFAIEYAPQNYYCFSIDKKATESFHANMRRLAECFLNNVFLAHHEYSVDGAGHNMGYAHFECFKELAKQNQMWKYVFNLQNHDVLLKTNQELVQILTWMDGANDVEVYRMRNERVDMSKDWSFAALKLFKNETLNFYSPTKNSTKESPKMNLAKGLVESSFSRAAVDFMLQDLNLNGIMQQLETDRYGIDEILLPTLQATDDLRLPGGFTNECQRRGVDIVSMTRYS